MRRILLVKTSSMGDVVHTLPIVNDIRTNVPTAEIHWVVEEAFSAIPHMHSGVKGVIPIAIRRWRQAFVRPNTWREIQAFRRRLRDQAFDIILDTQGLLKSALISTQALEVRYGYDRGTARE